jgi:hypothetical protein
VKAQDWSHLEAAALPSETELHATTEEKVGVCTPFPCPVPDNDFSCEEGFPVKIQLRSWAED